MSITTTITKLNNKADGLICERCDKNKWDDEYLVEINKVEKPPIKKTMWLCKTCASYIREYGHKIKEK